MNRWVRWLILMILTGAILVLTVALIAAASPTGSRVSEDERPLEPVAVLAPDLAKALAMAAPDERLNIIIEMREQVTPDDLAMERVADAGVRRRTVDVMQATAERAQASVRLYLSERQLTGDVTRVTPFWIFNGVAVNGARPEVVRELAARPDVALIRLDHWRRWIGDESDWSSILDASSIEWGIERIRADQVWRSLGISGAGAVVANLDTGVDWQHPALQENYRGYDPKGFHQHAGSWYDATGEGALYPVDGNGHGSHTMGTLVGQGGIGVAPGAHWIAVRAFDNNGFAFDSWIHAGFEWLLAPNGDPDLAPQVVNNSWGSNLSALTVFQPDLKVLRAAGILAVFSAGNSGPGAGTVSSPASLPGAFAVGASDQDDQVVSFSSRGPSPWGEIRPHVVAPGVRVVSTLPGGAYGEGQGTSMAVPHAAGIAALMLSVRPDLSITQTAYVITSTAVPLTETVPNNNTGYGRVDAYAAVALAADAGLISGTVYGAGVPLPGATIRATPAISGLEGVAAGDSEGHYRLFLGAGYYDLVVSVFGYDEARAHAVPVNTGAVTTLDFDLAPLPTGRVKGTVTAAGGGAVEATVSVLGTPVTTVATDGSYEVDLPSGRYTLQARALGYRVVTTTATVTAGKTIEQDLVLSESMRVLLVDSGSWYYGSQIPYYRQALEDLSYAYDEHRLKRLLDDTPTVTELLAYDLVIWSAPDDSPGLVGAGEQLESYLKSGGDLLLSGQDVAYWDGGGNLRFSSYYLGYLHSFFMADNAPSRRVVCSDESALRGITLTIQGDGGADNQVWPDELGLLHPDYADLACTYEEGNGAVIQTGRCEPYRALNLGFGFEAIDSAAARADFMARALDWFASPRPAAGVELLRQTDPTLIAPPGAVVTHTVRLRNLGEAGQGDRIYVDIEGDQWQTTLLTTAEDLEPCATTPVHLRVEIPTDATWDAFDAVTVTARSSVAPTLSQTLVITSKAPAPVLLVDDDRWFDQEEAYESALEASLVPYDRYEVTGIFGNGSPSAEILGWYPVVLWFTGFDWFDPLHPRELDRLTGYLEDGGRLFVSSQDALYYIRAEAFTGDYFGVISYSWALSQTTVQGVPEHVLGGGLGPVELVYPFKNWSDSVLPNPGTEVAFRGQTGQPGAVTREGACTDSPQNCHWRTAFFAFPVEALPDGIRETLISRLVGWLSWLGRSDLQSSRMMAHIGDTVGYTLTLRNDGPEAVVGASISNTLPSRTVLVDGPDGDIGYDPAKRRLTWTGNLSPGAAVTSTYRLRLSGGTADLPIRNTAAVVLGDQGLHFQRHTDVRIAAPDLSASSLTLSQQPSRATEEEGAPATTTVRASTEALVTLMVRNDGLDDALDARVDNPLPWLLRLITGTLSSSGTGLATELPEENRVRWEGEVAVGALVTLTYRAVAPSVLGDGIWLYNTMHLDDGLGGAWERGTWLYVKPHRWYLPIYVKDG